MNYKDNTYRVDNKVRELRTKAGLTQDDLASAVDATRQTIISIEKGDYVPSVLLAMRLADALGKKVSEVFSYESR